MISVPSLHNVAVWIAQVLIVTSIGALLPFLFGIRHPRSNLVYYRLLLFAALLLPLLQPVHRDVVLVREGTPAAAVSPARAAGAEQSEAPAADSDWRNLILGLLAAGVVTRIFWLAGGLWQLRRLRNSSKSLHPFPPEVENARAIVKTGAVFRISETIKGPVTFGFLRPVILLPKSFLDMPKDARRSVACHELLHVQRRDWLMTITEELMASFLWFQPAVWWLVAQSRLAREQLVDAAVVAITASRESYIQTLFSLADAKWEADLGVASLFLRRRHLIHRVHSLLTEVSMSRTKLLSSYGSMAVILALAGALSIFALPLTGEAEVRVERQTSPGYVVNRSPISYPIEAQQKRVEGTVVVELTFNVRGEIVDSRVLSGPDELRQAGLQTALQGKYPIDVARTLQVLVEFKLPAPGQRGPGQRSTTPVPGPRGARAGGGQPGGPLDQGRVFPPDPSQPMRVGARIAANNLLHRVPPVYPELAQKAQIRGAVALEAHINKEGRVENLTVATGHPLLIEAAMDAVKQWTYRPILLNGQPVDIVTTIEVTFP
jgi:TonB family protein